MAVRLRRDFGALLNLIRAHALLHRATRVHTADGAVVASLDDYAVVRELIADLVADGVDSSVSPQIRETVEAVRFLQGNGDKDISQTAVAIHLQLDKGSTSRRIRTAVDRGYLKNLEERKGRPAKLQPGELISADVDLLPPQEAIERDCCTVAQETESNPFPSVLIQDETDCHTGDTGSIFLDARDVESTGWPIALPELGPAEQTEYEQCHACQQGTWQRYGGVPFCKLHALRAMRNHGRPKTFSASCDSGRDDGDMGNHTKGDNEP